MKRIAGYKDRSTAVKLAKSVRGKVRRNTKTVFGKKVKEYGVFK